MKQHASARWEGNLKEGTGLVSLASGVLTDQSYSFATRFENRPGTNPEELIAAAHASCFSMALSAQLGKVGVTPERISTKATVTLGHDDEGPLITAVHLEVSAILPPGGGEVFDKAARAAKEGCPISRLLNAEITMEASFE